MSGVPPNATMLKTFDKAVLFSKGQKFVKWSLGLLNNGKWETAPFFVFAAIYALVIWFRIASPEKIEEAVMIAQGIGYALGALLIFCITQKTKPAVLFFIMGLIPVFLWFAFAFKLGLDAAVFFTGIIITFLVGIAYWRELAKIKNPQKVPMTQEGKPLPEPVSPPGLFDNISWMKPDGGWADNRKRTTSTGYEREVKIPTGANPRKFVETYADNFAGILEVGVECVELELIRNRADRALLKVHDRMDFLEKSVLWPLLASHEFSLWKPFPLGFDQSGKPIYLYLNGKHLLIGGESGSGKSNVTSMICAVGAFDPNCDMYLFDGKRLELYHWRFSARGYVQDSIDHALMLIQHLEDEMFTRYDLMNSMSPMCRNAFDAPGVFGPVLIVIDELAGYLREGSSADANKQKRFRTILANILEKGRAAGFIVVGNTQRPSAKLFDGGDLRAGFTYRMALRMADSRGSAMILGEGYAADASLLDQERRGMAYLIEKGLPKKMRAHVLPDSNLSELIESAPVVDEEYVWGRHITSDGRKGVVAAKAEITAGGIQVIDRSLIQLPNGKILTEDWHIVLYNALSDEYQKAKVLQEACGKTTNPVNSLLRSWNEAGAVEPMVKNGATYWRLRKAK